jgi:drug/metabolite transporter (DMT)-like permease
MNPTIKAGYKTTEFYISVITALIGLAVVLGYVDPAQAHGAGLAAAIQVVGGILGMVVPAATYAISRGLAKASPPVTIVPASSGSFPLTPLAAPAAPATPPPA